VLFARFPGRRKARRQDRGEIRTETGQVSGPWMPPAGRGHRADAVRRRRQRTRLSGGAAPREPPTTYPTAAYSSTPAAPSTPRPPQARFSPTSAASWRVGRPARERRGRQRSDRRGMADRLCVFAGVDPDQEHPAGSGEPGAGWAAR